MRDNKQYPGVEVRVIKAQSPPPTPIQKADQPTQIDEGADSFGAEWLIPSVSLHGLKVLVSHSSILPQCIRAYKNNVAGFGIGIRYKEDFGDETQEMKAEYDAATEVIDLLNMDMDTKEVFENTITACETYGIAYLEAIRDLSGQVVQIEPIRESPTVRKSKQLEPYVDINVLYKGKEIPRRRKFRKYCQQISAEKVYFKEFGDPRIMDKRDGGYISPGKKLDSIYQANEILEFAIGTDPYGEVRWIGQILGVDGSRKAESLNNRYFEDGRHTPLLIMLKGGTLTESSFSKLQQYMDDIKGEKGQHSFIILEAENADNRTDVDQEKQPEIQVVPLASVLQKDELFQGYLDNNRRKTQSAFQLPDLYIGYTTDFNRATAQTAMEVTEQQVFQPYRTSIAWIINNKLLADYRFQYVEAYLKAPRMNNPEDVARILNITERAGGLPPNKAKDLTYSALGEVAENYDGDWGDVPLAYTRTIASPSPSFENMGIQLTKQIQKAQAANDDAVVAVMKEVRKLLLEMQEADADVPV